MTINNAEDSTLPEALSFFFGLPEGLVFDGLPEGLVFDGLPEGLVFNGLLAGLVFNGLPEVCGLGLGLVGCITPSGLHNSVVQKHVFTLPLSLQPFFSAVGFGEMLAASSATHPLGSSPWNMQRGSVGLHSFSSHFWP